MTDWKDIHPGFTDELQAKWEQLGFNIEKVEKWIDAGLEPDECGLAVYIKEFVFAEDEDFNSIDEIKDDMEGWEELLDEKREEYYEDNERVAKKRRTSSPERDWTNIDSKFTPELVQEWKNYDFDWEKTRDWINIGMKVTDAGLCAWLRDEKKVDSDWVLDCGDDSELREEYKKYQEHSLTNQQIQVKN